MKADHSDVNKEYVDIYCNRSKTMVSKLLRDLE